MSGRPAVPARDGSDTGLGSCVVADLGRTPLGGSDGVVWHLPHGGDLDANLVRLGAGAAIDEHRNHEVDVLVYVQSGSGQVLVDGRSHPVAADHVVLVGRGASRSIEAGALGLTFLSVHRRRGPMNIGPPPPGRP